jgi:drug/metabolite transporter (DMT)-like permease
VNLTSRLSLPTPSPAVSRGYLLLGAILWSLGGYFIKEIDAGALSITFFRCLFAAAWLLPFVPGRTFPRPFDMAVCIALFALLLGLYVGSTKTTTAANAIFLQYTAPVYVIMFSPWLLAESLRRADALPLAICLGGIAVLFAGNQGSTDTDGLWMGLGSGFFYGLFLLWLRRLRYADPIAITFANCVGVAVILAPFPGVWDVDGPNLGLLALMGLVQFAVPYVLFTRGLQDVTGGEASLIALIEPVLNPIWVLALYGEEPTLATVAGGAIILAGLGLRYAILRPRSPELAREAEELAEPT